MKAILRIGFLTVATIVSIGQSVHAIQVTYSLNEGGGSGLIEGGALTELDQRVEAEIGTYQFSGSIRPDRVGLIGVSSGFRAAVSRIVDGFNSEFDGGPVGGGGGGGEAPDSETGEGGGPFEEPFTAWTDITIDTRAAGTFQTLADINGLSATNEVGFVQFDWLVTGTSNIYLDATGPGDVTVNDALSLATLRLVPDEDDGSVIPDTFLHQPSPGSFINDLTSANLEAESFLVPYDVNQLENGGIPQIEFNFEFAVETFLDITNDNDLGNFEALFDANFSNTATLANVTVLDSNLNEIIGASVVDSFTGQSLVASSVPEPSAAIVLLLAGCAGVIGRRRRS